MSRPTCAVIAVNLRKSQQPFENKSMFLKVMSEHKKALLASSRAARKSHKGGGAAGEEEEEVGKVSALPAEVLIAVFRHLNPVALAHATCVSR